MAGHSKWANIQHRKKAQDAKRGKLFTKLIREVSVAARMGGSDPTANSRLRLAMDKAVSGNVPKDTLERAIKRAAGEGDGCAAAVLAGELPADGSISALLERATCSASFGGSRWRRCSTLSGEITGRGEVAVGSGSSWARPAPRAIDAGVP